VTVAELARELEELPQRAEITVVWEERDGNHLISMLGVEMMGTVALVTVGNEGLMVGDG
jgi:hypothetical protein